MAWSTQRDKVALRLARIGHSVEVELPHDWWPRLLDAALPETPGPPQPEVSDILQEGIEIVLGAGGEVGPFREMLLVLRETTLHGDSASVTTALRRAHIWQTVERAIDSAAERLQALDRLRAERFTRTLVESNELLISSFELEGVMKALADQVPRLNIPRALVSLYEMAGDRPTGNARLILAFAETGAEPIPPGGVVFPYAKLAPEGMLPVGERRDFIIEPLVDGEFAARLRGVRGGAHHAWASVRSAARPAQQRPRRRRPGPPS